MVVVLLFFPIQSNEPKEKIDAYKDECAAKLGKHIRSCHIKDVHLDSRYTLRLEECGPGDGEFPLRHYAEKMHEQDPDMPIILEHLDTDEQYIKHMNHLKEVLNGLYKTI